MFVDDFMVNPQGQDNRLHSSETPILEKYKKKQGHIKMVNAS